jgi:hypothetical protein
LKSLQVDSSEKKLIFTNTSYSHYCFFWWKERKIQEWLSWLNLTNWLHQESSLKAEKSINSNTASQQQGLN